MLLTALFSGVAMARIDVDLEASVRFDSYIDQFGKGYDKDSQEYRERMQHFLANEKKAEVLNSLRTHPDDAKFGWTKFSDYSSEEFAKLMGYKRKSNSTAIPVSTVKGLRATLQSVDWRDTNKVTPVKDQGVCGSCWAFSAVESIESAALMKGTEYAKTVLSEQQVVSCDTEDAGCDGGDLPSAWEYVQSAGGLEAETMYPYKSGNNGRDYTCKDDKQYIDETKPIKWTYATPACNYGRCKNQDEDTLAANLASQGPIGICVNAGSDNWQTYNSGVMTPSQCGSSAARALDHCVQLVGVHIAESDAEKSYWIVRNSWAADWGVDGYIHLEMGDNTCGVANEALYVTLE